MARIAWKEAYALGFAEIDKQHQHLLELINDLAEFRPGKADRDEFFNILNRLVAYADKHFATEEKYLQEHGYPALIPHQREHVKFVAEVFRLAELLSQGDQHMHRQILDFTRSWYTAHVLGTDRKYKEFLKERGVQ